ncbi:STYKc [Seminavis robusta]|uniref:STYKc n=1 Tax=Seminavis robusta TaxID=568900 RepID=A0A9N8DY07_9STRA|nr:STYKc [Seminavis robusta]|eukprot:Sro454_g146300.1 STYKc (766) ;mRNA; f:18074-20456
MNDETKSAQDEATEATDTANLAMIGDEGTEACTSGDMESNGTTTSTRTNTVSAEVTADDDRDIHGEEPHNPNMSSGFSDTQRNGSQLVLSFLPKEENEHTKPTGNMKITAIPEAEDGKMPGIQNDGETNNNIIDSTSLVAKEAGLDDTPHNWQTLEGQQPNDSFSMPRSIAAAQELTPGAYAFQHGSFRTAEEANANNLDGFDWDGNHDHRRIHSSGQTVLAIARSVEEVDPHSLPQARPSGTSSTAGEQKENPLVAISTFAGLAFIGGIVLLIVLLPGETVQLDSTNYTTVLPSMAPTSLESLISSLFPDLTARAVEDKDSAQYRAFQWLLEDPFVYDYPKRRILQRHALMTIFYSTAGPTQWFNSTGWGSYDLHECLWFQNQEFALKSFIRMLYPGFLTGFLEPLPESQCDKEGLYQHLWLDQNNLVGSLPEELYSLTSLQTLSTSYNHLFGSLSSRIGKLSQLQGIAMLSTDLSGSIPKEIGSMSALHYIGFNDNKLEGSIPDEIWQLSNLDTLAIGRNKKLHGGKIPSIVGTFSKLRWLVLEDCGNSGTIPTELGQAKSLEFLLLSRSQLSGMLPSEIGSLSKLRIFSVLENLLQGTLPSQLGLLTSANRVTLSHNFFTGTLPSELGFLRILELELDSNQFSGTIPSLLPGLSKLEYFTLGSNRFTGEIPSEFGLLTSLGLLTMDNNLLSGTVPTELAALHASLYYFQIERNSALSGMMPESLCAVNGTCTSNGFDSCPEHIGVFFDCTELLCGCDCSCNY